MVQVKPRMLINTSATFKKCAKRLLPFIVGIFAANLDAGIPAENNLRKISWLFMVPNVSLQDMSLLATQLAVVAF